MADSTTYNFQSYELHKPALDEVASVLNEGLTKRYEQVSVEVTECPNLTEEPFNLAGSGLNGKTALCDVGGPPYLIPMAQKDREPYAIDKIAQVIGYDKDAFLLGAACGPHHLIGQNCEMIPNVAISVGPDGQQVVKNNTHICKTLNDDKEFEMFKLPDNNRVLHSGQLVCQRRQGGQGGEDCGQEKTRGRLFRHTSQRDFETKIR
ncbi:Ester hydrolase C11orf54 -like protein [Halotydeus destructor]|nr:Ester hydrolase C11orf54 -like protein [Halotydeus destructor]